MHEVLSVSFDSTLTASAADNEEVVFKAPLTVSVPEGGITVSVWTLLSTMSFEVSIDTYNTLGVLLNETFTMLFDCIFHTNINSIHFLFFKTLSDNEPRNAALTFK